jgi:hypothetical protein
MANEKSSKKGHRTKVASEPVGITIRTEASLLQAADAIASDLDKLSVPGLRHSRHEVMRAALLRGIQAMRADVDARLKQTGATAR